MDTASVPWSVAKKSAIEYSLTVQRLAKAHVLDTRARRKKAFEFEPP